MSAYRSILKQYWGYDAFRGIQEDIIESIGNGHDTLGLMPTGGGKSITFQVPALAQEGLCIVITPLVALMKDQVRNLREKGIKALAVYSGMTREEIIVAYENCIFGNYKFLYISPERIDTELFRNKMRHMKVCFITVDEAHCISQWGYDFRPSYLYISEIRKLLPQVPILALTATATTQVVKDIQAKLGFEQENVFRMSFERKNLAYVVRKAEDKLKHLLHILSRVEGSAIVYARTRKHVKEYTDYLNENDCEATYYHAGLSAEQKDRHQNLWDTGKARVMVATNAFGMGIDKPDVRVVIHMDMPDCVEAYFQEAGRAGRDGEKSYAVLLYNKTDRNRLNKRLNDSFPVREYIRDVYDKLCYFYQMAVGDGRGCSFDFSLEKFCWTYNLFPTMAIGALQILSKAGYIEYVEEQDYNARIHFTLQKEKLYQLKEYGEEADKVMSTILRNYTGVFSDYVMFDEALVAERCQMTQDQLYHILLMLTRAGVLHYIPSRRTPMIAFVRSRVEGTKLFISKEIYEARKQHLKERIDAMLQYAEDEEACRSRLLLHYFGECNEHDCGQCDVCIAKRGEKNLHKRIKTLQKQVLDLLSVGELTVTELMKKTDGEERELARALRHLVAEEKIVLDGNKLRLSSSR